jgi:hypothetical protein
VIVVDLYEVNVVENTPRTLVSVASLLSLKRFLVAVEVVYVF